MTARHDLAGAVPTTPRHARHRAADQVEDVVGAEAPTLPLRDLPPPPRRRNWVFRFVVGTLLMAALVVGGTAFRVWQVARVDDRQPVDAVIVLGAAQYDGEPSSIFAYRLRHAEALYEDGLAPRIVTTGGSRTGDAYTEAEAGRRYLIERGVPAGDVIAVAEGSDTLGSLQAVAGRAEQDGWSSALVVSDPWHSLRARSMARDSGLGAWTSPTRSGPVVQTRETQLRYIVRETAALLYYQLTHASVDTESTGLG
jgi:uncharacterized SAM-binding protein YcdF (DUF218 family)